MEPWEYIDSIFTFRTAEQYLSWETEIKKDSGRGGCISRFFLNPDIGSYSETKMRKTLADLIQEGELNPIKRLRQDFPIKTERTGISFVIRLPEETLDMKIVKKEELQGIGGDILSGALCVGEHNQDETCFSLFLFWQRSPFKQPYKSRVLVTGMREEVLTMFKSLFCGAFTGQQPVTADDVNKEAESWSRM